VSHLLRALETFQALGIEFVSLTEGVDTSTPAGRMIFTVLGAVAELERSLIAERVKAGLRNARAKGKTLGRPKVVLDASRIAALRNSGLGWKKISKELGVGVGTVLRIAQEASEGGSKNPGIGLSEPQVQQSRENHRAQVTPLQHFARAVRGVQQTDVYAPGTAGTSVLLPKTE
jgi:hypothetical protein